MKGRKIEKYELRNFGITIDIKISKDLTFFAEIGSETIISASATDLKDLIYKKVKSMHAAKWKPIIRINHTGKIDHPQEACFELDYERYYYAQVGDRIRKISWASYEARKADPINLLHSSQEEYGKQEDNLKNKGCTYHRSRNGEDVVENLFTEYGELYKPYSDELWNGLEKLRECIKLANYNISQLLSTKAGISKLMNNGKLLIEFQEKNKAMT